MKKNRFFLYALSLVVALGMTACGGSDDDGGGGEAPLPEKTVSLSSSDFVEGKGYFDGSLYYSVTSEDNKEVEVKEADKEITAAVIPHKVSIDGVEYSVTRIGDTAFGSCKQLASVTIPESVTEIKENAFVACESLTSIVIPKGVTKIERNTFAQCIALESVTIPEGVTEIGLGAFQKCSSLTSITLPASLETLVGYSFMNCSSLADIHCKGTTPPISVNGYPFSNTNIVNLYIPKGCKDAYQEKNPWKSLWDSVNVIEE